jgi:hypothetical protein
VSAAVALVIYLGLAFFFLKPEALWSPDEGAKLLQAQSLRWENGKLAYDILYTGRQLDPELKFAQASLPGELLSQRGDKLYFQRLPIFPALILPLYRWFGYYGLYILPALGGALIGFLALLFLEPKNRRLSMWLLIAFGSPVLIYATLLWEHTLATALALGGAWLALRLNQASEKKLLPELVGWSAVGLVFALSVYIRQEVLIFSAAFLVSYGWIVNQSRREVFLAAAVLGLALLPYPALHRLMFSGQPVPDNARYLFYPFAYLRDAGWRVIPDLLIGPNTDGAPAWGWLGAIWSAAAVGALVASLGPPDSVLVRRLGTIFLVLAAMGGIAFLFTPVNYRSAHGLLLTTPWVLVGLFRAREVWQNSAWRGRLLVLTTLLGLIGYVIGIVLLRGSSPQGGPEWGARFALTFFPLLAIMAAWDWKFKRSDVEMGAMIVLLLLGFGFQARGLWRLHHDKTINAELNQAILNAPPANVVSDLWWMPLNAAPIFPQKAIFVAVTPEKMASWINYAADKQVQGFTLVTLNPNLPGLLAPLVEKYRLQFAPARRVENLILYQVSVTVK